MINAEVSKTASNLIMVRFSEPNEEFKTNKWIPVQNEEEVKRRVYFKNRMYILQKLTGWLDQRKVSDPTQYSNCMTLIGWLSQNQYSPLFVICEKVTLNRKKFEAVAPSEKSRYRDHYLKVIVPILNFCEENQ